MFIILSQFNVVAMKRKFKTTSVFFFCKTFVKTFKKYYNINTKHGAGYPFHFDKTIYSAKTFGILGAVHIWCHHFFPTFWPLTPYVTNFLWQCIITFSSLFDPPPSTLKASDVICWWNYFGKSSYRASIVRAHFGKA